MRARKRFGQNFLTDRHSIDRIISAINPRKTDHIIEVGPGHGALTSALIESGCDLTVIEIDRDLAAELRMFHPRLRIVEADVLKVDFDEITAGTPHRIVGNLPYNISTPLLFKLFGHAALISDMYFMLQLEVVERMVATPSAKDYGRLSVMTQYHSTPQLLFTVPPAAFSPRPKVTSAIVRLASANTVPPALDTTILESLVTAAFSQRRKTIRNALKTWLSEAELTSLQLDPSLRPENLSLADFVACANLATTRGRNA